jgi:hypothetical protein
MSKRTESENHIYATGNYRLWYNKENGALHIKLDGEKELYYISKESKTYSRLLENKIMEGKDHE